MKTTNTLALALMGALFQLAVSAHADDAADLTAASDEIVRQLNARNVEAVVRFFPEERSNCSRHCLRVVGLHRDQDDRLSRVE